MLTFTRPVWLLTLWSFVSRVRRYPSALPSHAWVLVYLCVQYRVHFIYSMPNPTVTHTQSFWMVSLSDISFGYKGDPIPKSAVQSNDQSNKLHNNTDSGLLVVWTPAVIGNLIGSLSVEVYATDAHNAIVSSTSLHWIWRHYVHTQSSCS